ncbi:metallophosphoesterase [Pelomonas sp. V22]|uniref:metallophosphoesterase n=1 Tax=Pelomonas sp. V22 TaxID=2822139 RepID=UPI0024A9A1F3|nr:metallophosphoesterase [Pelomonas sp. V22]MDI4635942.1 metallophosphoesterase [Pelomonas sp. V22]
MKIQLASDLHLEFDRPRSPARIIEPEPDADLLVLAGDIDHGSKAIEAFADWPVPVVYVAGNHEFYARNWERTRAELREAAAGTNVTFLDNDVVVVGEVRFLGSTLWTDFRVPGRSQADSMREVGVSLNDYFQIRTRDQQLLSTSDTLMDHLASRSWLEAELAKPWPGKTVVISHHGPHRLSIHPRHAESRINGAFASDLTDLLRHADVWLHGHVHDSFDYKVCGCRVVANPAGYWHSYHGQEFKKFDPALVLEIENR